MKSLNLTLTQLLLTASLLTLSHTTIAKKGDAKKIKEENKKEKEKPEITAKDRKKHEEIAGKIVKKLSDISGVKEADTYEEFQKKKKQEAEKLEDQYQSKLKKGINLDIIFAKASKDIKDSDVDFIDSPAGCESNFWLNAVKLQNSKQKEEFLKFRF